MDKALTVGHWLLWVLVPWAIATLPSVIVALTPYPQVQTFVVRVLNALSILAHKDSPGTLKLPLTMSRPPEVVGGALPAVRGGKSAGRFTLEGLLAIFGLVAFTAGVISVFYPSTGCT